MMDLIKKIKNEITIARLTFGIMGKFPSQRKFSMSDGVGMTFGEKHFTKEPRVSEAVKTGRQGKAFYERLKKVGLLE